MKTRILLSINAALFPLILFSSSAFSQDSGPGSTEELPGHEPPCPCWNNKYPQDASAANKLLNDVPEGKWLSVTCSASDNDVNVSGMHVHQDGTDPQMYILYVDQNESSDKTWNCSYGDGGTTQMKFNISDDEGKHCLSLYKQAYDMGISWCK